MHSSLPPGEYWQKLAEHYQWSSHITLNDLFTADPGRAGRLSIELGPLYVDYSKNNLTDETMRLLTTLARLNGLQQAVDSLYSGAVVNRSEKRSALHTALRGTPAADMEINRAVDQELARMTYLHDQLATGKLAGFSGKAIDTIVNIGIGGSELGPRLLTDAFSGDRKWPQNIYFVANMDPADIGQTLRHCTPDTTLFIISSKSFTTLETVNNYTTAKEWLIQAGCSEEALAKHFMAATANPDAARQYGIQDDNIFRFWDWVGGRYSVWSAAGLTALLAIGPQRFRQFLDGGALIDQHFKDTAAEKNVPVILALIGIWYINFYGYHCHAVVPYDHRLSLLAPYLGQLVMESTGKSTTIDGQAVTWHTGPVTWGGTGTNSQHSFFQALHQGSQIIPVDFLIAEKNSLDINNQHTNLFTNCLAQSRALMTGDNNPQPHRNYSGNRPSNTLLYNRLTPEVLGAILAIYEHKTYVQALLWRINPFDQWGVELGKTIARKLKDQTYTDISDQELDSSTRILLDRYWSSS